jgi:hypothetical protein
MIIFVKNYIKISMNSSDKNESYSLEDLIKNNPDCSEFMSPEEAMKELGLN